MIAGRAAVLHKLARSFNRAAIAQLRDEVARLAVENEKLREERDWHAKCADSWQDFAELLQEERVGNAGGAPASSQDTKPHLVPGASV